MKNNVYEEFVNCKQDYKCQNEIQGFRGLYTIRKCIFLIKRKYHDLVKNVML